MQSIANHNWAHSLSQPGGLQFTNEQAQRLLKRGYRYAYRQFRNHDDAVDMAQEALYRAAKHFHRLNGGSRIDQWFTRIIKNVCIDEIRKRNCLKLISLDTPLRIEGGDPLYLKDTLQAGVEFDPFVQALSTLSDDRLEQLLKAIPENFARVVKLFLEDYSYEEIALAIGRPLGTVRSRLYRGKMLIKEYLQGCVIGRAIQKTEDTAKNLAKVERLFTKEEALYAFKILYLRAHPDMRKLSEKAGHDAASKRWERLSTEGRLLKNLYHSIIDGGLFNADWELARKTSLFRKVAK